MGEWLHEYRTKLAETPQLEELAFPETLAGARKGHHESLNRILVSSLPLVVDVAEDLLMTHPHFASQALLIHLIETGNAYLEDCLAHFAGGDSRAYRTEVCATLRIRMYDEFVRCVKVRMATD